MRELIKNNRNFIMGLAIIWIGIYHVPLRPSNPVLNLLIDSGYGGVDFFVFAAGFGMYYSLLKDDHDGFVDLFEYAKRKARRLLTSYLPFITVWMILKKCLHRIYMVEVVGNLTMTGWLSGHENQFNWYIDFVLIMYLIGPFLYSLLTRGKCFLIKVGILMMLMIMIGISFFHGQLILAMSRLPIFLLGLMMAILVEQRVEINNRVERILTSEVIWILLSVLGIFLLVICRLQTYVDAWHYGLYWYPFLLIVPGAYLAASHIGNIMRQFKPGEFIEWLISKAGEASLEIFFVHLTIFEFMQLKGQYNLLVWMIAFVLAFTGGFLYHYLIKKLI